MNKQPPDKYKCLKLRLHKLLDNNTNKCIDYL